jgi:PKD repeat protein
VKNRGDSKIAVMKIINTSFFAFCFGITAVFAQTEMFCGQKYANERFFETHPGTREHSIEFQKSLNKIKSSERQQNVPYIIPTVFHIIHNYGVENVSNAQIEDAVRILNEDFRMRNADTSTIVPAFKNIKADSQIEFRLAKIDPNGNCTNGITRTATALTYAADDNIKGNQWDPSKYLNIWVVNTISFGAAGYAYYPSTADFWPEIDGIVILYNYLGSIGTSSYFTGRALTHEVGHYLELAHVWGDTNDPGVSCGDDYVSDTPETKGWTGCNLNGNICIPGVIENVQNYMEYAYCSRMFSAGQRDRMHDVINSGIAQRDNLCSQGNLVATGTDDLSFFNSPPCPPIAEFKSNYSQSCVGSNIIFNDMSENGVPSSWNWTFIGGTPSTSTLQNPTVNYATPGTFPVKLVVSNSSGADSIIKNNCISINSTTAQYVGAYSESFEGSSIPNNDWFIENNDLYSWEQATPGHTGQFSMHLNNSNAEEGVVDAAVSPSINVASIPSPILTFKVSYAVKTLSDSDRLRVLTSVNCGRTWTQRYSKKGPPLATAPQQFNLFIPSAGQWRTEVVNINNVSSSSNAKFKFEFTGGAGNDIYIDDINILGTVGLMNSDEAPFQATIYPNPFGDQSELQLNNFYQNNEISIKITDVLGRIVYEVFSGRLPYGKSSFRLSGKEIGAAGIYFLNVSSGNQTRTLKLIVE